VQVIQRSDISLPIYIIVIPNIVIFLLNRSSLRNLMVAMKMMKDRM